MKRVAGVQPSTYQCFRHKLFCFQCAAVHPGGLHLGDRNRTREAAVSKSSTHGCGGRMPRVFSRAVVVKESMPEGYTRTRARQVKPIVTHPTTAPMSCWTICSQNTAGFPKPWRSEIRRTPTFPASEPVTDWKRWTSLNISRS